MLTHAPKIKVIKEFASPVSEWNGPGLVFRVKNGLGQLRMRFGSRGEMGLQCLTLDGVPLAKVQGDNYFCPTCEKMISAGYGLDKTDTAMVRQMREVLDGPISSLEAALVGLGPVLGLLDSGYYALVQTELYPTDGQGHFFWTLDKVPRLNRATCMIYDGDGRWAYETLSFLLPTQPPRLYNQEAAEGYRSRPDCLALGFAIGSFCALLDGHHKATAAALEGRRVKVLVIVPVTVISLPKRWGPIKPQVCFGGHWVPARELGISRRELPRLMWDRPMSPAELEGYIEKVDQSFGDYDWPPEIMDTAGRYPDAYALACLQWAGDLSDSRLDAALSGVDRLDEAQWVHICNAMALTGHGRFLEVALTVAGSEQYATSWLQIFKLLAQRGGPQVEEFFIDYLIHDEGLRPQVTRIVDDYFRQR